MHCIVGLLICAPDALFILLRSCPYAQLGCGPRMGLPVETIGQERLSLQTQIRQIAAPHCSTFVPSPAGAVRQNGEAGGGFVRAEEIAFLEEARRWRQQRVLVLTRGNRY